MQDWVERLAEAHRLAEADPHAAKAVLAELMVQRPGQPMALHLLGVLMLRGGCATHAVSLLAQAAAARPENNDTLLAYADALAAAGRHGMALGVYRRVLRRQSRRPDALVNLAALHLARGDRRKAEMTARLALQAAPDLAAGHAALASALLQTDPDAALRAAEAALARDRELWIAWFVSGTAHSARHRYDAAIGALARAVQLRPQEPCAWLNLGNAHGCRDEAEAAERCVRHALALDPTLDEAHASLGWLLTRQGRLAGAVAACDEALRLRPSSAKARWNRATAHLLAGNFAAGWEDYEWRRHPDLFGADSPRLPGPEWQGEDFYGRPLLVLGSQGMGDIIQCARFLPALAACGPVTLICPPPLLRLLRQLPLRVVSTEAPAAAAGLWVDIMSLPRLLRIRVDTIPDRSGYLTAGRLPATAQPAAGRRVGVVWAGNPAHPGDAKRSMPLAALAPVLRLPGQHVVSLQVGPAAAAIERDFGIPDSSGFLRDFAATARLIATLDIVICVDTAVAHLAGALGKPVWIMLPHAPDWRWQLGRRDTPWYSSAQLFRQVRPGDWASVVEQVAAALVSLPQPARNCRGASVRTSPGPSPAVAIRAA